MERKIIACVFLRLTSAFIFAAGERHGYPTYKEHSRPYAFSYGIKDPYAGNDYERSEVSDGDHVTGSYTVQLPDGRKQIVKYAADHDKGFVADVSYYGEAKYPPPHKQEHGIKYPPYELHNIKPILPKYKPKLTPHALPIKPIHSKYVPSIPELHIQQVQPINKPKLQKLTNYGTFSKPIKSIQHPHEIRPYKMPIKSVYTEYKPSVPHHEIFHKPISSEYKPKRPHKPIRPMPEYRPAISHKPIIPEYKPDIPHKPIIPNYQPEVLHEPIIPEYKPENPFKPTHLSYELDIPHKPIIPEFTPDIPHKPIIPEYKPLKPLKPMNEDYESYIPHKPIMSEYKPDIPHKPIISEYKPETPFQPMNLDYESGITHEPISEYKPDVPHKPIIPVFEPELSHIDSPPIYEDTIYSKVKAKRQKFPPYFPDKGPTQLPEISPFFTLKDIPLENSDIEEGHKFKQSNAHLTPIHNLASISVYTPIKQSSVPKNNFGGLDPSIIADDIPILPDGHGNQPNFDTEPLFKDGQYDNYKSFPNFDFHHKEPSHIARSQFPDENNVDEKINLSQDQISSDFRSDYQESTETASLKSNDKSDKYKNHEEKSPTKEDETIKTVRESQRADELVLDSQLDQLEDFHSKKLGIKKFVRPKGTIPPRRIQPDPPRKPVVKRDMKSELGEASIDN